MKKNMGGRNIPLTFSQEVTGRMCSSKTKEQMKRKMYSPRDKDPTKKVKRNSQDKQ
jgi:hypothetical protein